MNPLSSNKILYYQEIADYSGIVATAQHETQGLTDTFYESLYLKEAKSYYNRKVSPYSNSWKSLTPTNKAGLKLWLRLWSRLYVTRKMNPLKEHFAYSLQYEAKALHNVHYHRQNVAADKTLALATELREVAEKLCEDTLILRKVRLGRAENFKPFFASNPQLIWEESVSKTARRIKLINHFRILLTQFDTLIFGNKSDIKKEEELSPWAPLLIGISLTDLLSFFTDCKLLTSTGELTELGRGNSSTKARKAPWVGALQALILAGLLDENAAAICRAMADPAGKINIKLNEGTLRDYSNKSKNYIDVATEILRKCELLRK